MPVQILAAADLHLGKRSSGMDVFADDCSTKLAWKRMVDYAVQNSVDIVLLAGDVIDRNNRYYEASSALREGFQRLKEADIMVFVVSGNHDFDVLPQVIRNHSFDNVYFLGGGGRWDSVIKERNGAHLQFIGWSFPRQYVDTNPLSGLAGFKFDPNCFRIGLLHADLDNLESRYSPVSLLELQNSNPDIWVLGHIHKPSQYAGNKIICYPGSLQSLSAKEKGSHGALLFTIDGGRCIDMKPLRFSNCYFEQLNVDVSEVSTEETARGVIETARSVHANGMLAELENTKYLIYDVHLIGQNNKGRDIENWIRLVTQDDVLVLATGTKVLIRNVSAGIRPIVDNLEALAMESSPVGLLAQSILALRSGASTPFLDKLKRDWDIHFESISNSKIYQPLQDDWQRNGNLRSASSFIEDQCNKILSELLYPTN